MKLPIAILIIGLGTAVDVCAEDLGLYVGASLGSANLAIDNNYFGPGLDDIAPDDRATAWKTYAGFKALPFLAVEAGYTRFGDISQTSASASAGLDADTWAVFGRGLLPIGPLHLFGKVGYHFYNADISLDRTEGSFAFNESESGQNLALGAGAGFDLGDLTLRAEYEVFLVNDLEDLSLISVGVSYSF